MADNEQFSLFEAPQLPDAFRKAVQVVHSKPKQPLTLVQRKIANAWLKQALAVEPDSSGWWVMSHKELAKEIDFDSNNIPHLKTSAAALMTLSYEWDVISSTAAPSAIWKASVLFPEVEIHREFIRFQFSNVMRERLINPDVYAVLDMNIVRKFRRAASLAIWENCVRYENVGQTPKIELGLLRDMVLGEDSHRTTYDEYKFFKSKVLKPAITEINAISQHTIEMLEFKTGKSVVAIQFKVARKESQREQDSIEVIEIRAKLVKLGLPQSEATKLSRSHPLQKLVAALNATISRRDNKKLTPLENPAAFFRKILPTVQVESPSPTPPVDTKPTRDIKTEYRAKQLIDAEGYFKELDVADQTGLIEKYNAQQSVKSLQISAKKPGKAALVAFYNYVADTLWGPATAEDLLAFAQSMFS